MRIDFCGVRGSLPAPGQAFVRYGGHTSCLALSHDRAPAPTLMLDAGTGLTAAASLFGGGPFAGTILLSHLHWDHTYGLPFFAAGDRPDARVQVLVPEPENGASALAALTGLMSPPYFPVTPGELRGEWQVTAIAAGDHEIEGFRILAREIPHKGGRTLGYRITDGKGTLTYIPDHNPAALGPGPDGFGEYHPAACELARDTDVLVHDSQLFPDEIAAEGDFGHALGEYAIGLAARSGARRVVLFHHKFTRTDDQLDALARRLQARQTDTGGPESHAHGKASPEITLATEGETIEL